MYRKEIAYYFVSPVAYIVIGLYLLTISLFLWVLPGGYNIVDSGYAQLDGLFQISPWLFIMLCPALTMRLFAEERASGMWDLLMTKPYPLWRIVVDKYLAALTLVVIALLPCITHFILTAWMAEPMGNMDLGQFAASFIGLNLLAAAFLSISLACATCAKSQIVCFILAAGWCFCLYWAPGTNLDNLMMQEHYSSLSRGVIDARDIAYFLTIIICGVTLAYYNLSQKKK